MKQLHIHRSVNYLNIYNHRMGTAGRNKKTHIVFWLVFILAFVLYATARAQSDCLTWAPPDTSGYTRITYTSGGTYTLNDNTDYVVVIGNIFSRTLRLDGGRNIVIIGGEFNITNGGMADNDRMGIRIFDGPGAVDGRIVHIEGIHVHGSAATEGIQISAPKAVVQIQNFRVSEIYGAQNLNHSDFVQPWGGCKELRIDKLTGYSNYQGLFTNADFSGPLGPMYMKRIDMHDLNGQSKYFFWWDPNKTTRFFIDDNTVWIQPASATALGKTVWPDRDGSYPYQAQTATDATGEYAYWPDNATGATGQTAVRNFDNTARGIVRKGSPPGGEYVPAGTVGMSYISPGYESNGTCGSAPLSLSVDGGGAMCAGDCTDLTATASGGEAPYTYVWSPAVGNGAGPHNICPAATTTYSVTVTDGAGNMQTSAATVTVGNPPAIDLGNDTTVCAGSALYLDAGGGFVSYIWSMDDSLCYGLGPSDITAIGYEAGSGNVPDNVSDGSFSTRWSNLGKGSWIQLDLGALYVICGADIAWYNANSQNNFEIALSADGSAYTTVFSGTSNDSYLPGFEPYVFNKAMAQYVRITVNGNAGNDWASITEIRVSGNKGKAGQIIAADSAGSYRVDAYDAQGCSSSDVIQVQVDACTGTEDAGGAGRLTVYPNPTAGELRITNDELRLKNAGFGLSTFDFRLYDLYGKVVLENQLPTTNYQLLDLSHLPAGVYFLTITTDSGTVTEKIVKH